MPMSMRRICRKSQAQYSWSLDDEYVIAGQGTIGLEILDKLSDVDTVIVPIGGAV